MRNAVGAVALTILTASLAALTTGVAQPAGAPDARWLYLLSAVLFAGTVALAVGWSMLDGDDDKRHGRGIHQSIGRDSSAPAIAIGHVGGDFNYSDSPKKSVRQEPRIEVTDASEPNTKSDGHMWRLLIKNLGDSDWLSVKAYIDEPNGYPIPWRPAVNKVAEKWIVSRDTDIVDVARVQRLPKILFSEPDDSNSSAAPRHDLDMFSADVGTFRYPSTREWPVKARLNVRHREGIIWAGVMELDSKENGDPVIRIEPSLEPLG